MRCISGIFVSFLLCVAFNVCSQACFGQAWTLQLRQIAASGDLPAQDQATYHSFH